MARGIVAGKYQLNRLLGRGGMGEVHEATHLQTGRRVALKMLTYVSSAGDDDPERLKEVTSRFYREARATGQINSPHVVEILDAGADTESGQPFIAMEYLVGKDLQQILRETETINVQSALKIAAQAALGLARAHALDIIHRDIKPANLFLTKDERTGKFLVKLVDFGIARLKTEEGHDLTQDLTRTGSMLGSPNYMAPEQARGLKNIDARVDVWSLGVVLYKLLSGTTPHERGDGGLGELLIRICVVPAPSIQTRAAWVPPGVATLLHKVLKLDPNERYATGQEFYDALLPLIEGDPLDLEDAALSAATDEERAVVAVKADISSVSITKNGAPGLLGFEDGSSPDQTRMTSGREVGPARSRSWIGIGAAAAAALAAGVGVFVVQRNASQPTLTVPEPSQVQVEPAPTAEPLPATPAQHTVSVFVPKKSKVKVNGEARAVEGDAIALEGTLGSTFEVEVTVGAQTVKHMVSIVNSNGTIAAWPGLLEMPRASSKRPATTAPAAGPAPAPAPAPKPDNGLDHTFR